MGKTKLRSVKHCFVFISIKNRRWCGSHIYLLSMHTMEQRLWFSRRFYEFWLVESCISTSIASFWNLQMIKANFFDVVKICQKLASLAIFFHLVPSTYFALFFPYKCRQCCQILPNITKFGKILDTSPFFYGHSKNLINIYSHFYSHFYSHWNVPTRSDPELTTN